MPKWNKKLPNNDEPLIVIYQYSHPKTIYTDCIYRKIHKKSKGQTLRNVFAFIEK
jgi:hypothetical protein